MVQSCRSGLKEKKRFGIGLRVQCKRCFQPMENHVWRVANYNYIEDKQTFKGSLAMHSVLYAPSPFRPSPLATWHLATCLYLSLNLVTIGVMLYVMLTLHKLPWLQNTKKLMKSKSGGTNNVHWLQFERLFNDLSLLSTMQKTVPQSKRHHIPKK